MTPFTPIFSQLPPQAPPLSKAVAQALAEREISKQDILALVTEQGIYDLNEVINQLGYLFFYYAFRALNDHVLTPEEKMNALYLKRTFGFKEGFFFQNFYRETQTLVSKQLQLIYADNKVTEAERQHIADIQELFDLSFAQMDEFKAVFVDKALADGANLDELDTNLSDSTI